MLQEQLAQAPAEPVRDRAPVGRAPWPSRLLDLLLLVSTVTSAAVTVRGPSTGTKVGLATLVFVLTSVIWIVLGLIYATVRIRRIRRARRGDTGWPGRLAGRRTTYLITLGTALIVLSNGTNIVVFKGSDLNSYMSRVIGITMVLVAWTILQLAYSERYARMELENTGPAHLDFPATPHPSLLEYAYFAFTVGSTFGTSDVTVQTSRMRGVVLCHGLLAFVYNTAVLGMVLSLIAG
ncbi:MULTISPECIES: DUF1345 domain-containing protein [Catenuloplanes]|uniref:Membrane protein n=1 Tax=Catenuloplanes niger TaxID=587534 RepID=A0AAE3ZY47_9ACTN|nr:DUF1345 domain-containing protein [Catenuloplanes niger]MDR7326961.1 putative membrane protein [Catenuloplanes niger]